MATGATPTQEYGGYDEYDFVQPPPDRLLCQICKCPSRNPYMSLCCGHAFCKSCLDGQRQARSIDYVCPVCREVEFTTVLYKALDREIKALHIYCTNKKKGCEWQGELNNVNSHLSNGCVFEEVKCSNECGKMIERRYMTSHVETECPRRKVNCQYCHDTGEHQFIEGQHKEECPKFPLPCPNKCDVESVPREDMEAHKKECPLEMIQCEYYNVGCEIRMAREDIEKHKKEKMDDHLMMMHAKFTEMQQLLQASFEGQILRAKNDLYAEILVAKNQLLSTAATKDELSTTNEHLQAVANTVHHTSNNLGTIEKELSAELLATKELAATKTELATVHSTVVEVTDGLSQTKRQLSTVDDNVGMTKAELVATINQMSTKLSTTTNELSKMKKDLQTTNEKLEATRKDLEDIKGVCHDVGNLRDIVTRGFNQKFKDTEESLDAVQRKIAADIRRLEEGQQQAKLDQWTLRLHTLSISGDKTCPVTVRVSEVADKKKNKTKWHSYPFYTHDKGYRMCLRVIINGTGQGEGTHVSVFLYLMKGNYDSNLSWPLLGAFEIALLNQKMDGEHFINNPIKFTEKTPSAIANKVSAKQPDEIARDGLGRNEFISHKELEKETDYCQFLKDDCIFIRVRKVPAT